MIWHITAISINTFFGNRCGLGLIYHRRGALLWGLSSRGRRLAFSFSFVGVVKLLDVMLCYLYRVFSFGLSCCVMLYSMCLHHQLISVWHPFYSFGVSQAGWWFVGAEGVGCGFFCCCYANCLLDKLPPDVDVRTCDLYSDASFLIEL